MYFMHLWQCTGDKPASKEQSPWICFTAVKLSTLWTSCSRGNNKRNSWSNYQADKNALNFKKGSDKRHLQLSQTAGCQGLWIPAAFQAVLPVLSGHGHTCDLNRKSQNSCLCCRHDPWGTPWLLRLFWEEEKGKEPGKKKIPQEHRQDSPFTSNSHATPAKCCTYWFYQ